ncbi:uncharacterized protein LOC114246399 [Bombyx mandarina]|nr:uncharacterized protein LOC114246399 [Bombyx mandarina]
MIIFKGKRLKPELYDNLPPGSLVEKSAKGYMTNELFKEFLKHLARYKSAGKSLLIFDGAACHLDLTIVEVADSLDISLYCLPSNTTHELQPLDKAVYRSFEHHWDAEVLSFMEQNPDKRLTKARFNVILSNVWSKCMTHNNITSGFKTTGLYPLNPQAIPETAFAPSLLTEVPGLVVDTVDKENSQPRISPKPITPRPSTSTAQEERIDSRVNRPSGTFYRMVYGSSSSDDEEDQVPLALVKRTAFQQLMPTPAKNIEKTQNVRRKAINYRGTPVIKDLFDKNKKEKKIRKRSTLKERHDKQNDAIWYCHACEEDKMEDMRACSNCGKWYHEECVGLTVNDIDNFECPDGC